MNRFDSPGHSSVRKRQDVESTSQHTNSLVGDSHIIVKYFMNIYKRQNYNAL